MKCTCVNISEGQGLILALDIWVFIFFHHYVVIKVLYNFGKVN